ncbi:hypothetical protein AXG93_2886s1100 [Marchantia polymorpha subsp. ruderalis]|uniref:N-acetyltransferase domain-containing protein n=1 Tax=Marchantia polymorpha subsp. ruderalis TaxID=1480154 RepID=A0A176WMS8_MARPO|nr:hypothetical protein AXG93_2886s1100 [Marchantia polymorpha subsp. ruderalis]
MGLGSSKRGVEQTFTFFGVVNLLIQGLADYEGASKDCHATESALNSTLFQQPPFVGTTVFLLELGPLLESPKGLVASNGVGNHGVLTIGASKGKTPEPRVPANGAATYSSFHEESHEVNLTCAEETSASAAPYRSPRDKTRTIVGFALCFPRYVCYMARNALFIDGLHVREAFRRQGLGTILLTTVAQQAAKRGFARVDWIVEDWNVSAIKFYEGMGAPVMPNLLTCRLKGDNLGAYAS